MSPRRFVVAWTLAAALACGSTDTVAIHEVVDPTYVPGQEWSFEARPGETGATLIVLRTEDLAGVVVVHVALHGLQLRNPAAPGGVSHELAHAPFAREALDASGLTLLHDRVPIPAFDAGYDEWRRAHGGVWTASVGAALTAVESGLAR